jgi:hypothetical protein
MYLKIKFTLKNINTITVYITQNLFYKNRAKKRCIFSI